jgi:hypothetical protein
VFLHTALRSPGMRRVTCWGEREKSESRTAPLHKPQGCGTRVINHLQGYAARLFGMPGPPRGEIKKPTLPIASVGWAGFRVSYAFDFGRNTKLAEAVSFPVMVTS